VGGEPAAAEGDQRADHEQAAARVRGDLVERAPERPAEHAQTAAPDARPEDVVGPEEPQRNPARAGHERRDRADEPDEAAEEHRLAAVARVEALDLLDALRCDLEAGAVAQHEVAPEAAPEQERGEVAGDRRRPDHRDEDDDRDLALAGHQAADEDERLPGREQADERPGLQEGHHADEQIRVSAERRADALDDPRDVGQADEAEPVRGQSGDDDRQRGELELAQPPPAPEDVGAEERGAEEGERLHARTASHPTAAGVRSASPAAARRARSGPSAPAKRPTTVGPEPATMTRAAPARAASARAATVKGASARAAGPRSLTGGSGGGPAL